MRNRWVLLFVFGVKMAWIAGLAATCRSVGAMILVQENQFNRPRILDNKQYSML